MSSTSSIEWTDKTWNPVTGCDKVSPGCAHCYAEGIAKRLWPTSYPVVRDHRVIDGVLQSVTRPREFTDVMTHEDRLLEPLSWRKPARVFVNSMSDLFHDDVPFEFIDKVFAVMAARSVHAFQILTKRPERMRAYMADPLRHETVIEAWSRTLPRRANRSTVEHWPLPNVWLGVSVENQHFADERIPLLLQTPAAVRFISAEPLLGPVSLGLNLGVPLADGTRWLGSQPGLDWVIVGGESGPRARPFDLAWARSIVAQCKAAGVPVFVKQLGAVPMQNEDEWRAGDGQGRVSLLSARNHRRVPEGFVPIAQLSRKGNIPAHWPDDLRIREFPGGA